MAIHSRLKRTQSSIDDSQTLIDSQACKKPRSCPLRPIGTATVMVAKKQKTVTKDAHHPSPIPAPLCALTASTQAIRRTYMIPKDVPTDTMNDLEHAWGLAPHTFDFDGLDNTLNLTQELCEAFEAGNWALVPTDKGLMARLQEVAYQEGDNANIKTVFDVYKAEGKTTFTFSFLPFPDFEVDISRFEDGASGLSEFPSQTIHKYPYEEFPALTLPLYPHLAIANFMLKYSCLGELDQCELKCSLRRNAGLGLGVMASEWIWKRWAPVREYPHLPPVHRSLDALIIPSDSTSCRARPVPSIVDSGVENEKEDDDNDELEWKELRWRFTLRVVLWLRTMQKFKDKSPQNRQDFCSSKYTELPPTRPSSPIFYSFDHAKSVEDES